MTLSIENLIAGLASLLKSHSKIVVFSGAGISTESGISDYRSKGGLWDRFQPVTIQEFLQSEEKRKLYWAHKMELLEQMEMAKPNAAHKAVAQLWNMGKLHGVITQNIDGLHQEAGLPDESVVELHGTNRETVCLSCNEKITWQETLDRLRRGEGTLRCRHSRASGNPESIDPRFRGGDKNKLCQGLLKPNTISFGQALDRKNIELATLFSESCDMMLVVGSTLVVEPAASLPRIAKGKGAELVIINLTPTPLDEWADLVIQGKAGEILPKALDLVNRE